MPNNYGLTSLEIDEVRTINPETAAHNIAHAYINSSTASKKLYQGEEVILSDVLSLSSQYAEAYNYAYNYITSQNKLIDHAE